ncbi:MAG: alpha-rhamnosidase [Clostridia bacterium]|nr:alpha-rhamnosidase [Clostridia bacterium]
MKKAKWIWRQGDFENYHGELLHSRRTEKGVFYPAMWRLDTPARSVMIYKIANLEKEETVTVYTNADEASLTVNGKRYPTGEKVPLEPGRNFIKIGAHKDSGFPAFYCVGDTFASDESWSVAVEDTPVGTNDMYTDPSDDPEVFKFAYKRIYPVSKEEINGGTLFDFGNEFFGKLVFENVSSSDGCTAVCGESREEASDPENAVVYVKVKPDGGSYTSESVAFRYVSVPSSLGKYDLSADFEYLPVDDVGYFRSDNELINRIWDVADYTLHLNSREGFFDGIKRDRWVWSGDAYQSYSVNYYLMNDRDIVRRTQRILRGTSPMMRHINTIPDYTFYWISANWEYYYYTGDRDFIKSVYPLMLSAMEFAMGRLDEDGLYEKRPGDWVFIDWATTFDRDSGPVCAEQMLLCRAYGCMAKTAELLSDGENAAKFSALEKDLCEKINELYWDDGKHAFADDWKTGNRNVTRHANIFALLFGLTSDGRKAEIIENVIKNPDVPAISTPYFEFFELDAMCGIGDVDFMTDMLKSYWGGMIEKGATTFWESYLPEQSRVENYAMYGRPYGKSLCHAWGSSPIYLIGKYVLGVRPTSPGYAAYEVVPNASAFKRFEGKVPAGNGVVSVSFSDGKYTVTSDVGGGTLIVKGKRYSIEKGVPITVEA